MSRSTRLLPLATVLAATAVAVLLPGAATSAVPASGTVSPASTSVTWQGGPAVVSNPSGVCVGGVDVTCDLFLLTITPPATGNYSVQIRLSTPNSGDDWDLYVSGPDGTSESSTSPAGNAELVTLKQPGRGHVARVRQSVAGGRRLDLQRVGHDDGRQGLSTVQYRLGAARLRRGRAAGKAGGAAAGRHGRLQAGRGRYGEGPRRDPERATPWRSYPAGHESRCRQPSSAHRQRGPYQPRPRVLRQLLAVPRALSVHVEAAADLRARRVQQRPPVRDGVEQHDRRVLEVRQPPVHREVQRRAWHLSRLGQRGRGKCAGALRRR